jgi:MFS family permease
MQYSKDPTVDRSLRHSVRDGMASSAAVGSAETYLSAFALFFRASASQVALLATLPALLGALGQFLAAWMNRDQGRRKPLIVAGAVLQAVIWLLLGAMALWLPEQTSVLRLPGYAVPLLLVLVTLYFFCGQLTVPLWTSLMGDLVPEKKRGRFFGRRTRLTTITSFAGLVGAGIVLHLTDLWREAGWGFALVFGFAALARLLSAWNLSRMHEPVQRHATERVRLDKAWWQEVKTSGAPWFSLYVVAMQAAVAISGPLFAIYMLRALEFSYLQLMLTTGISVLVQFLTLNYWGRIADAFGNRLLLSVTSLLLPLTPALWLLADSFWYLLIVQCISGLAWGGFSLSSSNLLYELVPAAKRATYSAFQGVVTASGIFAGGMLGVGLLALVPEIAPVFGGSELMTPLLSVFLISALARLAVAAVLLPKVREARAPRRHLSTRAFIYRVTRFNAFVGLAYEVVASIRRPPEEVAAAPAVQAEAGAAEPAEPAAAEPNKV